MPTQQVHTIVKFPSIGIFFLTIFSVISSTSQNCGFTISVPQDITICEPDDIILNGNISGTYFGHQWTGTDGYFNDNSLVATTFVNQTTTYTLTAYSLPTTNLIANGDFSAGSSGFSTDYVQSYPGYTCSSGNHIYGLLGCEGTYYIGSNSGPTHTNFADCYDHTGGGNMMMVNGAASLQRVWCQTVSVDPGKRYIFQAFATSIEASSPAILQFSINGNLLGTPFSLSGITCYWEEFYTTWSSGANTSVEICITNQNTATGGNDFAIDDLFFGTLCEDKKDFNVFVSDYFLQPTGNLTIDCAKPTTTLTVRALPVNGNYTYLWGTADGSITSNTNTTSITAASAGTYVVTVTNQHGCTQTEEFVVSGNFNYPVISIAGDTTLDCVKKNTLLSVSASPPGTLFTWTLPDNSTRNGSTVTATAPGIYTVSGQGQNNCITTEQVEVVLLNNQFIYQADSSGLLACNNDSVNIILLLGSIVDSITWSGPGISFINNTHDTLVVQSPGVYHYQMYIGADCTHQDSITINRIPPLFDYNVNVPNTLTCLDTLSTIALEDTANVAAITWYLHGVKVSDQVSWQTSEPGTYYISLSDQNGCNTLDSLTVFSDVRLPDAVVRTDSIDCLDMLGGFFISSSNGVSYLWEGQNYTSSEKDPEFELEGWYSLTITGDNGCSTVNTYYLPSSVQFPDITTDVTDISCTQPIGAIRISTSVPSTYQWSNANGISGNGALIETTGSGVFTITATSVRGCVSHKMVSVGMDTIHPKMLLTIRDTLTCSKLYVTPAVQASAYETFVWTGKSYLNDKLLQPEFTLSGTYYLTLTGKNGCITRDSIFLAQNIKKPDVRVQYADLTCTNPATTLIISGSTGVSYSLFDGNQTISIQPGYIIKTSGSYTLTAKNQLGCDSTVNFNINSYFDIPSVQINNLLLNCYQPTGVLYPLSSLPSLQYSWQTATGQLLRDTITVVAAGQYILSAVNNYGCIGKDTVNVNGDFEAPKITISGNPLIPCNDRNTVLTAITDRDDYNYYWNGGIIVGSKTKSITPELPGRYFLYAQNTGNGCMAETFVDVEKQKGPESWMSLVQQPLCFGEKGSIMVENIVGGQAPYTLLVNNSKENIGKKIQASSGTYMLRITDVNGCTLADTVMIDQIFPFRVNAGEDIIISLFESHLLRGTTTLSDTDISSISWSPASTLSCSDCPDPVATPETDTEYIVTFTNTNGCEASDTVFIRVIFDKGFVAPNIFSPGGSNSNDAFTIFPLKKSINKLSFLKIYDRWGNLVFITENIDAGQPQQGWNGRFGASEALPGVYVWMSEILYKDGTKELATGDITIVR